MDFINLWKDELSSICDSNMASPGMKDQFVSLLSSKHLRHFFFLYSQQTKSSYTLDSNILREGLYVTKM